MKNLEEIRKYFKNDRWATDAAGIIIEEAGENHARCSMDIKPVHRNALNAVMGGAIYTLADFTFAVAANAAGVPTVTSSSTINFVNSAKGDKLTAETEIIKDGRRAILIEIKIYDDLNTLVAVASFSGMHL